MCFLFLDSIHSYSWAMWLTGLWFVYQSRGFPCEESRDDFHTYPRAQVSFLTYCDDANDGNHWWGSWTLWATSRPTLERLECLFITQTFDRGETLHGFRIFMCRLALGARKQTKQKTRKNRIPMFTQFLCLLTFDKFYLTKPSFFSLNRWVFIFKQIENSSSWYSHRRDWR
jgi:hypothetical protein